MSRRRRRIGCAWTVRVTQHFSFGASSLLTLPMWLAVITDRSSEEKEGEEEAAAERLWLCEAVLLPSLAGLPGPEDQHLDSIE